MTLIKAKDSKTNLHSLSVHQNAVYEILSLKSRLQLPQMFGNSSQFNVINVTAKKHGVRIDVGWRLTRLTTVRFTGDRHQRLTLQRITLHALLLSFVPVSEITQCSNHSTDNLQLNNY